MNANEKFLASDAHVDAAAIQPLPNSRKIYVEAVSYTHLDVYKRQPVSSGHYRQR